MLKTNFLQIKLILAALVLIVFVLPGKGKTAFLAEPNVAKHLLQNTNHQFGTTNANKLLLPNYTCSFTLNTSQSELITGKEQQSLQQFMDQSRKHLSNLCVKVLPPEFSHFMETLLDYVFRSPLILFFSIIILLFISNVITVILVLYISNARKNRRERYSAIYKEYYESTILNYLFGESDWEDTVSRLRNLKRKANNKILVAILINHIENMQGEDEEKIFEIYRELGLHKTDLSLLHARSKFKKSIGLRNLTQLQPAKIDVVLQRFLNYNNDLVRAEAQLCYVKTNPAHPFDFFNTLEKPFTKWTQIKAFQLFHLHKVPIPDFSQYLQSENQNVLNFSLRMIIHYRQKENTAAILNLLDYKYETTRNLVIKAIKDLALVEALPLLKDRYQLETLKNRLEIIRVFGKIGTLSDTDLLDNIIANGSVSEKNKACRALLKIEEAGLPHLEKLQEKLNFSISAHIQHAQESRN